jgi:hypothetical protein
MLKKFTEYNGHYHDINIKLLEKFNNNLITEGLIMSVEYEKAVEKLNKLLKKYKVKGNSQIYPSSDRVQLNIYGLKFLKNRKEFYDEFKSLLNLLGYYISNYVIDDGVSIRNDLKFDIFNQNDTFTIWVNKKFDYENGIPVNLYHITYKRHLNKIKKQGLVTKTKNIIEKYPVRIYFFLDIDDAKNYTILRDLYSEELSEFVLLEIDMRLIKKIKLYQDPKFDKDTMAIYTYDNIPPNAITIIEEL